MSIKTNKYMRERNRLYPWLDRLAQAKQRCNNNKNKYYKNYGGRGIKFYLTKEEIKELWFRDKAYLLKKT